MERGRRSRRGCGRSRCNRLVAHSFTPPQNSKQNSFLNTLYSLLIMSSLIALIYLMLQYHCQNCREKCNINNISKSLDDIAKHLSIMKDSYYDLELKISRFSQELPKLEGQIDILETLANTIEKSHLESWKPITQLPNLPNVNVYLDKPYQPQPENNSNVCTTCSITQLQPVQVNQD